MMFTRKVQVAAAFWAVVGGSASADPGKPSGIGQLVISTAPEGASIAIDTQARGAAPLRADLGPGDHLIEAVWPSGKKATQVAHVVAGSSVVAQLVESAPTEIGPSTASQSPAVRLPKSTYLQLVGPDANQEKQTDCDDVLVKEAWLRDRSAPVQAVLHLEHSGQGSWWDSESKNHLVVSYNGHRVTTQPLGKGTTKSLCQLALKWVERALSEPPPSLPAPPAPPPPPVRRPPSPEAAKATAGTLPSERALSTALEGKVAQLAQCRDAYSRDTHEARIEAVVVPPGVVSQVDLTDLDNASTFANCVRRIIQQVQLAPYRGTDVLLRATVRLPQPVKAAL
jgi:hypothetical protein